MANSQTPSSSRPSFSSEDDAEFYIPFANLGLGKQDGFAGNQASASSSSNHYEPISTPISSRFPQTRIPASSMMNHGPQLSTQNFSEDYSFNNGGRTLHPYLPSLPGSFVGTSQNYTNNYVSEPMRMNASSGCSLMSTLDKRVHRTSMESGSANGYNQGYSIQGFNATGTNGIGSFSSTGYNQGYSSQGFNAIGTNGLGSYPNTGYFQNNNGNLARSTSLQDQHHGSYNPPVTEFSLEGQNIKALAMLKNGSLYLQRALQKPNLKNRNTILEGILDHIPELLADQYGHHLFEKLVESSNCFELQQILEKLCSQSEELIKAACNIHGSNSIQKLVKKLKKSELGSCLTEILARRFVDLATNKIARHVLKKSLSFLSNEANKVLYEEAIKHFDILVTHQVGCLALNDSIDYISEPEKRDKLLQLVVDKSVFLAHDPSGNFVLQHTVGLANPAYSDKICENLRGHYIQLCAKKFGSHVVEKCITSCRSGMNYAVMEIVEKGKALELAKHQYGNYVIQKALETTQRLNIVLCRSLVKALLRDLAGLQSCRTSKKVVEMIKVLV